MKYHLTRGSWLRRALRRRSTRVAELVIEPQGSTSSARCGLMQAQTSVIHAATLARHACDTGLVPAGLMYFTGGAAVCLQEEGQMGGQEFQPYPRTASGQTHPCGGLLQLSLRTRTPLQHESAILHQRGDNTPSVPIETKAPKDSGIATKRSTAI